MLTKKKINFRYFPLIIQFIYCNSEFIFCKSVYITISSELQYKILNCAIKSILFSAAKKWIAINRIQNKSFCLHNICVCTVCIYYAYINTHTYGIYLENMYMYLLVYI